MNLHYRSFTKQGLWNTGVIAATLVVGMLWANSPQSSPSSDASSAPVLSRAILTKWMDEEQERTNRLRRTLCQQESKEDCWALEDAELTLRGVRGELTTEHPGASRREERETLSAIWSDLKQVTRGLDPIDGQGSQSNAE